MASVRKIVSTIGGAALLWSCSQESAFQPVHDPASASVGMQISFSRQASELGPFVEAVVVRISSENYSDEQTQPYGAGSMSFGGVPVNKDARIIFDAYNAHAIVLLHEEQMDYINNGHNLVEFSTVKISRNVFFDRSQIGVLLPVPQTWERVNDQDLAADEWAGFKRPVTAATLVPEISFSASDNSTLSIKEIVDEAIVTLRGSLTLANIELDTTVYNGFTNVDAAMEISMLDKTLKVRHQIFVVKKDRWDISIRFKYKDSALGNASQLAIIEDELTRILQSIRFMPVM
ncbi:MAG: hypothetical protein GF398_18800 [Chitinivibrionales bacterium]|nr:hypothetical protein [Chitinivibrionales bacterium]